MKTENLIKGLQILLPFYDNPGCYSLGAEHDALYAYPTARPLPADLVSEMVALGWFQEEAILIDNDAEFSPEDYDPEEAWTAYV